MCFKASIRVCRATFLWKKKIRRASSRPVRWGEPPGSWLCLLVEWGHQITARTMALHSEGSLKWAGSGGERLAEASGGLPGVRSALTEHATTEWLESMRGNEKLVATQPEPRVAFDADWVRRGARERWWRGERSGEGQIRKWRWHEGSQKWWKERRKEDNKNWWLTS